MLEKEWWMPLKGSEEFDNEGELDFLCDHLGDASEVMDRMWEELCKLRDELPTDGFVDEDD